MKRFLLLLAGVLLPMVAQGAVLGRFFTTPELRSALEEGRRTGKVQQMNAIDKKNQEKKRENRYVTIHGVVKRSGGPATVWVNGDSSLKGGELFSSLTATGGLNNGAVRYHTPEVGEMILYPGQTLATANREVQEGYTRKEPVVAPEDQKEKGSEGESGKKRESSKKSKEKMASGGASSVMKEADKLEKMLEEANKLKAVSDQMGKALEGIKK